MVTRVRLVLPLLALALAACSGGSSSPPAATRQPASTPSAVEYAQTACRFYQPGSLDRDAAQKFVDNAHEAAQRDGRWGPLEDAADQFLASLKHQANVFTAIQDADDACKQVP